MSRSLSFYKLHPNCQVAWCKWINLQFHAGRICADEKGDNDLRLPAERESGRRASNNVANRKLKMNVVASPI